MRLLEMWIALVMLAWAMCLGMHSPLRQQRDRGDWA
jgi:hypothetical protein